MLESAETDFAYEIVAQTEGGHHNYLEAACAKQRLGSGNRGTRLATAEPVIYQQAPIGCLESQVLANERLIVIDFHFLCALLTLCGTCRHVQLALGRRGKDGAVLVNHERTESTTRQRHEYFGRRLYLVGVRRFDGEQPP